MECMKHTENSKMLHDKVKIIRQLFTVILWGVAITASLFYRREHGGLKKLSNFFNIPQLISCRTCVHNYRHISSPMLHWNGSIKFWNKNQNLKRGIKYLPVSSRWERLGNNSIVREQQTNYFNPFNFLHRFYFYMA